MSVRVVARIRPLLKAEIERDVIVDAACAPGEAEEKKSVVRIPNPKNDSEAFSFQFNSVYGQEATQAQLFDNEVSPTVKHLFKGYDATLFAYGVTGTGKTHTMRGGKSLAERGVIPRLLSSIYRKARKLEKDSADATQVEVSMSYYEIYNDRVFDLFEPPEKRTPAGLPIRDVGNGKTQVVGLTERPCSSLKDFELLYDQANVNRSTSATKLNAHSSRSHAILCVKITQTTGDEVRVSTASAIDLAGSEDNRRTDNKNERMVESASINKSLFVLAQCVEAISRKQARIPYRESKMTRILSLGQNNGFTVMILNLAPVRSYHLDTLSSLNFANRTKKIEVKEVENLPFYREAPGKSKIDTEKHNSLNAPAVHRQPLRPKVLSQNCHLKDIIANVPRPAKQFAVFSDKPGAGPRLSHQANTAPTRHSGVLLKSPKRTSSEAIPTLGRPTKISRPNDNIRSFQPAAEPGMTADDIEALIARKVNEAVAERADHTAIAEPTAVAVPEEVQRRLDALEKRVEGQETERAEGLQYLLMAKQHQLRGEQVSALKMYQLALPHFPGNEKLVRKMSALQDRIAAKKAGREVTRASVEGGVSLAEKRGSVVEGMELPVVVDAVVAVEPRQRLASARRRPVDGEDDEYHEDAGPEGVDEDFSPRPRTKLRRPAPSARSATVPIFEAAIKHSPPSIEADNADNDSSEDELATALVAQTPRTKHLLDIINTKDVSQIKLLRGVGAKKAEAIVNCLCDLDDSVDGEGGGGGRVTTLGQLGKLKGVGVKGVENMRVGLGRMVV
ncbi:hypothetical protein LTR91_012995 [Friedmanniomyces endolithicus]|uniref:Kinesin motor domain-containing protein n=1 Tax=Friedmanniomyces endolithicus TaxID=329885 RepID=A0A4U0V2I3_9PEZI|nr:hypothetical protein LTS09_007197 [Friedmanniomyces endolithicus]KAK0281743.1 hypothetical protein LTR35_007424 [Friedmanniomyces endolithicus]KAK0315595.1 hypothetical protein LTR01_000895 [Friedmanniomyces endolithicus]KAK0322911.1 hypothetical protein LTR82_005839 [Friedmanniomyces endolithicus]KAK0927226.1 hypothetical protein LTR57_003387 [Friedmanniomyces endolithicus]